MFMIMVIGHVCIAVQSWKSRKREKMPGIFSILLNFCRREASILRSMEPAVNVYLRGTRKYIVLRHLFPARNPGSAFGATPSILEEEVRNCISPNSKKNYFFSKIVVNMFRRMPSIISSVPEAVGDTSFIHLSSNHGESSHKKIVEKYNFHF